MTPAESAEGGVFLTTGLGFLLRFQHFLDAMTAGDKAKAAELLGALFASQDVPKSFLAVLLMDSVTLLEGMFAVSFRCRVADILSQPPRRTSAVVCQ